MVTFFLIDKLENLDKHENMEKLEKLEKSKKLRIWDVFSFFNYSNHLKGIVSKVVPYIEILMVIKSQLSLYFIINHFVY